MGIMEILKDPLFYREVVFPTVLFGLTIWFIMYNQKKG